MNGNLIYANYALILLHFDYCFKVRDTIRVFLFDRLQKLQNRPATSNKGRKNEHGQYEIALIELNFKTLKKRRTQFIASLMHKITHDLVPKKFIDIFETTLTSKILTYEALARSSICLKPKIK